MLKIVTWNVNSVRARLNNIIEFIEEENPDIISLQEIKCLKTAFPSSVFADRGYNIYVKGQKSYNGVALLSKIPMEYIEHSIPNFNDDQARFISADVATSVGYFKIINGYMPNGTPLDSEKFPYKLEWMEALYEYIKGLESSNSDFILCGDFNIIPHDIDVHDPIAWKNDALFHPESRKFYHKLSNLGLTDAVRFFNPNDPCYSFWDYQGRAREKDHGIRIDHFLLSPYIMDLSNNAYICDKYRDAPKASDHAPVMLEL